MQTCYYLGYRVHDGVVVGLRSLPLEDRWKCGLESKVMASKIPEENADQCQIPFALQALWPLCLLLGLWWCPESRKCSPSSAWIPAN